MDNTINSTIIEKVIIKSVAIYKSMDMLSQPLFEDKFKKETLCQQNENTQKQNSEKCLNEPEKRIEQPQNVDTNETKIVNEQENWRTITDPKLRKEMRKILWHNSKKEYAKIYAREYYKNNKSYHKSYYKKNKSKILESIKSYQVKNKDILKQKRKNYRDLNKDKTYQRHKKRLETDIQYKLTCNLRLRLNTALKQNAKSGSAVKDLGCTIESFKAYLESKFQPGMTWDNYGMHGWHIDHIKPLSSFDLTDRKQFLEACHYTNLQPLWAQDNLIKSNKLI